MATKKKTKRKKETIAQRAKRFGVPEKKYRTYLSKCREAAKEYLAK